MSRYLKHFTVVGDDPVQWSNNYQKWEEEEEEHGGKQTDSEIKLEPSRIHVSFQDVMKKLFSSHRFQILVVCLVIVDALLVLGELLMDLKIIHPDKHHIAPKVFHYLSLSILTIFLVEVGFKVFVYGQEFFHHKFEVLDGVVVIVSFILDLVLLFREHEFEAVGLLILLRLWRVARIINGQIGLGSFCKPVALSLVSSSASCGVSWTEEPQPCPSCLHFPELLLLQRNDGYLCPTLARSEKSRGLTRY